MKHIDGVPEHTFYCLKEYVEKGVPQGSFLKSVLSNNLKESFALADEHNRNAMFEIVQHLYSRVPIACWGSYDKYVAWLEMHAKRRSESNA